MEHDEIRWVIQCDLAICFRAKNRRTIAAVVVSELTYYHAK